MPFTVPSEWKSFEVRWATEKPAHSMPMVEELEYLGYVRAGKDPRYGSILMARRIE